MSAEAYQPERCPSPCCNAPCEPAVPFCQPMRIQYVGEPKLCSIICRPGEDQTDEPPRRCRYRGPNPLNAKLGYPVGILRSLVASSDKALYFDDKEMNGQRYAMCLKAFALLHILPIVEWNRSVLDSLMIEGAELYAEQPTEPYRKTLDGSGEGDMPTVAWNEAVYTKDEAVIKRSFKLRGYEFEVELGEKFIPDSETDTGDSPPDINLVTLKTALKKFFMHKSYCLLSTNNLYLLIWQSMGLYFVLDFYGRSQENLILMRDGGYATLLGLRGLYNVNYFIAVMTALGKRDVFTLRDMRITMMVDPEGRTQMRAFSSHRAEEFVQVNEGYAYLKSELHLSLREKDPLLSRCALPVSVAAIMASKIDHPGTWDQKMLNKIICYGFFVCRCCWEFCQNSRTPIDLNSFPNQLQMGQFAINITLIPQAFQGTWYCIPKYEPTDLSSTIKECFDQGYNYLILSVNQQNYAIFKKHNFYYLFDPYRHRLPFSNDRSASLRMFSSMSKFFKVLNLVLLESNTTSPFFIHRAIVTDIRISPNGECISSPPAQVCPDELQDVMSINEAICFREDYKRCLADLGQVSEDEEEESFDEADLAWPEEEEPKGEEEGAGELSGFDQGSSDSDLRLRKRRGQRGPGGPGSGGGGSGGRGTDKRGRGKRPRKGKGMGDDEDSDGRGRGKSKSGKGRGSEDDGDGRGRSKSRGGKGKKRERAGTSESEDDLKRRGRRGSRGRGSKARGSRDGGPGGRGSRGGHSKGRGSKGRGSKEIEPRGRGSRGRGSRGRGSGDRGKSPGDKGKSPGDRGDRGRDSKDRRRGSKDRGRSPGNTGRGSKEGLKGGPSRSSSRRGSRPGRDGSTSGRRPSSGRKSKGGKGRGDESGDEGGKKGGKGGKDGGKGGEDGGREGKDGGKGGKGGIKGDGSDDSDGDGKGGKRKGRKGDGGDGSDGDRDGKGKKGKGKKGDGSDGSDGDRDGKGKKGRSGKGGKGDESDGSDGGREGKGRKGKSPKGEGSDGSDGDRDGKGRKEKGKKGDGSDGDRDGKGKSGKGPKGDGSDGSDGDRDGKGRKGKGRKGDGSDGSDGGRDGKGRRGRGDIDGDGKDGGKFGPGRVDADGKDGGRYGPGGVDGDGRGRGKYGPGGVEGDGRGGGKFGPGGVDGDGRDGGKYGPGGVDGDGKGGGRYGPGVDGDGRGGGRYGPGVDGDGRGGGRYGPGVDGDGRGGGRSGPGVDGDGRGGGRYGPGVDGDGRGGRRYGPGVDGDGKGDGRHGPGVDRDGRGGGIYGPGGVDGDGRGGGRYGPDDDFDKDGRRGPGVDRHGRGKESDDDGRGYRSGSDDWDRGRTSGDSDMDYDDEERERRRRERQRKGQGLEGGPCKPNAYPGYSCIPYNLAVCGSESGTYESICKLLRAGFKCADRILIMTPWGNFVVFRVCYMTKRMYFVYDGCTCNVERFRHLDLNCGTAGLLCFNNLHRTIMYLLDTRRIRTCIHKSRQQVIDEICSRYCQPPKPCVPC